MTGITHRVGLNRLLTPAEVDANFDSLAVRLDDIEATNVLLTGDGVPSNGEGVDGDFYIDTTAIALYGPKATIWGSPTSLIGPSGSATIKEYDGSDWIVVPRSIYVRGTGDPDPTSVMANGDLLIDLSGALAITVK